MQKLKTPHLFEGNPVFHFPPKAAFTVSKPLLYRLPVTGERPIRFSCEGLPAGITLHGNILSGTCSACGEYAVSVLAENAQGTAQCTLSLLIGEETRLLSPLLGFTSWNAYRETVTQEEIESAGRSLVSTGLADLGYAYVNIDSGWQDEHLAADKTVKPNAKFPDLPGFCARMHALGLKCGIYETPMLTAWGCPPEFSSIPGCTSGERDIRFGPCNNGIGILRHEKANADKWAAWGFDYLKYDWFDTDSFNADEMRRALSSTSRDFAMSVTVFAMHNFVDYWKAKINSYRCNPDSYDNFPAVLAILKSAEAWEDGIIPGHFFDLDMLETGYSRGNQGFCRLTQEEQHFAYTMRVIYQSPIQLSSFLEKMDDFEYALYANDEVLSIHQDVTAVPHRENLSDTLIMVSRVLASGETAVSVFNTGDKAADFSLPFENVSTLYDVWAGETLPANYAGRFTLTPHSAVLWKIR